MNNVLVHVQGFVKEELVFLPNILGVKITDATLLNNNDGGTTCNIISTMTPKRRKTNKIFKRN